MSKSEFETEIMCSLAKQFIKKYHRKNRRRMRNKMPLLTEHEYMEIMKKDFSIYRIAVIIGVAAILIVYGILIANVAATSTLEDTLIFSGILLPIGIFFVLLFLYSYKIRKAFGSRLADSGKSILDEDILGVFKHQGNCDHES